MWVAVVDSIPTREQDGQVSRAVGPPLALLICVCTCATPPKSLYEPLMPRANQQDANQQGIVEGPPSLCACLSSLPSISFPSLLCLRSIKKLAKLGLTPTSLCLTNGPIHAHPPPLTPLQPRGPMRGTQQAPAIVGAGQLAPKGVCLRGSLVVQLRRHNSPNRLDDRTQPTKPAAFTGGEHLSWANPHKFIAVVTATPTCDSPIIFLCKAKEVREATSIPEVGALLISAPLEGG